MFRVPEVTQSRRRNRPQCVLLPAGSLLFVVALALLSACAMSPSGSLRPQSPAPSGISGRAVIVGGPADLGSRVYSHAVVEVSGPVGSREATRVSASEDGAFRVELRPGVYRLVLAPGSVNRTVTVEPGEFATATLVFSVR